MATYIQGIQTSVGVVKYDYNYLANLPESDMTLSKLMPLLLEENLLSWELMWIN